MEPCVTRLKDYSRDIYQEDSEEETAQKFELESCSKILYSGLSFKRNVSSKYNYLMTNMLSLGHASLLDFIIEIKERLQVGLLCLLFPTLNKIITQVFLFTGVSNATFVRNYLLVLLIHITYELYNGYNTIRTGKKGARPAEVGALASVFEKSATELKQQKLLKCKQTIQIAIFNIITLNRIGQLPELTALVIEHKIDIICIQEHRYTHTEDIRYHETGNGWMLATVSAWKNSVNAVVGGVRMLIGLRPLKTLNSIERIQPRMLAATFNGNPRATIISCYSSTNVSEETELVAFYDELSSLVRSIPKHNLLVIGRDLNAQIGKNRNNKYSLHNTSNRNGQHLIDFMIENRLTCLNTNYQKREGKLWTYTYTNNSKA